MISQLRGQVDTAEGTHLTMDVNGVGYAVQVSHKTLMALPPAGAQVTLLIQTLFRPESLDLYGFINVAEKQLFNTLMTVQGVGARVALAILSALTPDQVQTAIAMGDKTTLTQADGVGPKLAVRLITELKDKCGGLTLGGVASPITVAQGGPIQDAIAALLRLGFKRPEVEHAVQQASQHTQETSLLIKDALAKLTQGTRHG